MQTDRQTDRQTNDATDGHTFVPGAYCRPRANVIIVSY